MLFNRKIVYFYARIVIILRKIEHERVKEWPNRSDYPLLDEKSLQIERYMCVPVKHCVSLLVIIKQASCCCPWPWGCLQPCSSWLRGTAPPAGLNLQCSMSARALTIRCLPPLHSAHIQEFTNLATPPFDGLLGISSKHWSKLQRRLNTVGTPALTTDTENYTRRPKSLDK